MLLCQYCCRHKIYHLFSFLDCFECRAYSNLCFAKSDIPTDQPVHDFMALHIMFRIFYRLQLVFSFFKWKHFFKFFLPYRIRFVDISICLLTCCIQFHQIFRYQLHCTSNLAFGFLPLRCSEFI